jgi:hypothetical protein
LAEKYQDETMNIWVIEQRDLFKKKFSKIIHEIKLEELHLNDDFKEKIEKDMQIDIKDLNLKFINEFE